MHWGILALELLALYILSNRLTQSMYALLLLVTRMRPVAITVILLLYFPGTVVHELSHLFMAEILRVKTGKLTLVPESIRGDNLTPGSVMVAESDPLRRYLIGLAPIFVGILLITALSYFLPGLYQSAFHSSLPALENPDFYLLLLTGYCLFAVSNNMFSSPADLKGFLPFALVVAVFGLTAYILGFRIMLTGQAQTVYLAILDSLTKSLGTVLLLNVAIIGTVFFATRFVMKLTGARVVRTGVETEPPGLHNKISP